MGVKRLIVIHIVFSLRLIKIISDQLNIRKATDLDAGQEVGVLNASSIHLSSSVHMAKKAKREPSIFLRLLDNSLSIKK